MTEDCNEDEEVGLALWRQKQALLRETRFLDQLWRSLRLGGEAS